MANDYYPFISIVFPNWNGKDDTINCLNSLRNLDYPKEKLEIIITDNASTDGSYNAIKEKFIKMEKEGWYNLKFIENKKNFGASIARNIGIKNADVRYKYIWMIDNDVVVDNNALKELIRVADYRKSIGIVGSTNYYFNNQNKILFCGNKISPFKAQRLIKNLGKKKSEISILKVDFVSNSSLLIKKEVINKIGMNDPIYFCYSNDVDYCHRAKKEGFKIYNALNSKVWHKFGATTKKITGFKLYFQTRNRILLIKRNFNIIKYFFYLLYLFGHHLPWKIIKIVHKRESRKLYYIFKGLKDGLYSNYPSILEDFML